MKYGFTTLGLFLILFVLLFLQNAFSQTTGQAQETPFDPTQLINSLIDNNTGLPLGVEEQITIQQIPSIPKPGETVSVQITAYSTDLNKAKITWTIDGKVITSQTGAVTFQFLAPQSGKTSTLVIKIEKEGGGTLTKTIVVSPADVDLIYEAQTYVPPFYKGKKKFSSEAVIKFIAIPNFVTPKGNKIAISDLVYTWKVNGTVQQSVSGYGKNVFLTKGTLIERPTQVTVEVSAVNSTLKASQTIGFKSSAPEVVLYENNPILGIVYEKAIQGTFNLDRPQVDFEAVPYFFSGQYKDSSSIQYTWSLNGISVTSKGINENYLVLRNDKNEDGRALVNVSVQHASNIMQNAKSLLELNFKKIENEPNEQFTF
jgi:hypothetical protein